MPCVPMTWPVGQGKTFGGIMNLRTQAMTVFESGSERRPQDFETIPVSDTDKLRARFGHEYETAVESMELATGASPAFDRDAFLAGLGLRVIHILDKDVRRDTAAVIELLFQELSPSLGGEACSDAVVSTGKTHRSAP